MKEHDGHSLGAGDHEPLGRRRPNRVLVEGPLDRSVGQNALRYLGCQLEVGERFRLVHVEPTDEGPGRL